MSNNEKLAYVKALIYIALADDEVDESELHFLEQIASLYGLEDAEIEKLKCSLSNKGESIETILSGIEKRATKLTLLYDLLAMCYADGNYSPVEKIGLKNICDIMEIEKSKLTELENVMEKQVSLQNEVNKILER